MNLLPKFLCTVLLSAFALAATPAAQAQVGVSINIGSPVWGPPAPYGAQYYYIPEIDGYYDLYSQQYIVFQDGYWMPLPQLYGYDPYQFHPVVIEYRGREPWCQLDYYHSRYAYRPYQSYGREREGYYPGGGYAHAGYPRGYEHRGEYRENRGYGNRNEGQYQPDRGYSNSPYQNRGQNFPDRGDYNRNNAGQRPQPGQGQQGNPGYGRGGFDQGRGGQGDGRDTGYSRVRPD